MKPDPRPDVNPQPAQPDAALASALPEILALIGPGKPGFRTTEFWGHVAILLSLALTAFASRLPAEWALTLAIAAQAFYQFSRNAAKGQHLDALTGVAQVLADGSTGFLPVRPAGILPAESPDGAAPGTADNAARIAAGRTAGTAVLLLASALTLCGCTAVSVKTPHWQFTRVSVLQRISIPSVSVKSSGAVEIRDYQNDGGGDAAAAITAAGIKAAKGF